jgi:hypothetical protein
MNSGSKNIEEPDESQFFIDPLVIQTDEDEDEDKRTL